MRFKVYWRKPADGSKAWKLSVSTKKPVGHEEANEVYLRYVNRGCEAKIKEV